MSDQKQECICAPTLVEQLGHRDACPFRGTNDPGRSTEEPWRRWRAVNGRVLRPGLHGLPGAEDDFHIGAMAEWFANYLNSLEAQVHNGCHMEEGYDRLKVAYQELEAKLRDKGYCSVCWSTSWEPVEKREDCDGCKVGMMHDSEMHTRCCLCWTNTKLREAEAALDAIIDLGDLHAAEASTFCECEAASQAATIAHNALAVHRARK